MRATLLATLLLLTLTAWGQDVKRPDSYNFTRGVEEITEKDDIETGVQYLNKELAEHPGNGYAHFWIASVYYAQEQPGAALTSINKALKHIPSKDKEYVATSYQIRSDVYLALEDTTKALSDLARAIDAKPDDADLYKKRAQIYFEQERYDLSDADCWKLLEIDEGSGMGNMYLGRNLNARGRYDEAVEQFERVMKLVPDYSSAYTFRAVSRMAQHRWAEAADDAVTAYGKNHGDNYAFQLVVNLADSAFTQIEARLTTQRMREPNEECWKYQLGVINEQSHRYAAAIAHYKTALEQEASDVTANRIAVCCTALADYASARDYYALAAQLDSTQTSYVYYRGCTEMQLQRYADAERTMTQCITADPSEAAPYVVRAAARHHQGNLRGAADDYTTAIALDTDHAQELLLRGVIYRKLGEEAKAVADFRQILLDDSLAGAALDCDTIAVDAIAIDTMEVCDTIAVSDAIAPIDNSPIFALFYLGERDKAVSRMAENVECNAEYYDAACLYALMGEREKALGFMRQALEHGYTDFGWIANDFDLDTLRTMPEFKTLIDEYRSRLAAPEAEAAPGDTTAWEERVEEIPFRREGGVCRVKCAINTLPLHLIFDTGATDVSLSSVEATFMLKNDYLSPRDIIGRQQYMTANGEVSEGTVINLREVSLGALSLRDVRASVVRNQQAPLLLGQSVLQRLGRIEIDNAKSVLRITTRQNIQTTTPAQEMTTTNKTRKI